jgi:phosphoglycerate dehydrogenase-like enzyme
VLTPHPGYVTTRTMTHWYAKASEDIEAWRRGGTGAGADTRLTRPVSQRW